MRSQARLKTGVLLSVSLLATSLMGAQVVSAGPPINTTNTTTFTFTTTLTRIDRSADAFDTHLVVYRDGVTVIDQTTAAEPGPGLFSAAAAALAGCDVSEPVLTSSSETSATAQLPDQVDHVDETSTLTETLGGPTGQTIFVGMNASVPFFVAPGTLNIDENFHTHTFINQVFVTTTTHHADADARTR